MEYKKNADVVKLLFKMKDIKKNIMNLSASIKSLKVEKESSEYYTRCFNLYQEGACYFFQCCGFLKSQYIEGYISSSSKSFLLNNLYIPSFKKFVELRQTIALIHTEDIFKANLETLKGNLEAINNSMSELLGEFNII